MPTQTDTQSQIARKINFAIQLLRESAELLDVEPSRENNRTTLSTKRSRYPRRRNVDPRDE
jgi:hypothetical protein